MQAVIVDIRGKEAAALDENGAVVRIRNANYELGQTIELHEGKLVRTRPVLKRFTAGAAAAVLVAVLGTGTAYAMPYGTVSLEGEPSIEYTINCFDYVLRVRAVNDAGETVLGAMDLKTVRHHRVEDAVTTTMEQIEQGGYLEDPAFELRVSAETRSERHADRLRQELGEMVSRTVPAPDGTAMAREPREEGREPEALPAPTENLMPETKEQQEPRPDEAERYEGPITIEGRPAGPEGEQRPDMRPAEQEPPENPWEPDGNGPGLPEQNEPPQNAPAFF